MATDVALPDPILFTIKYDGLTDGEHDIDLASFGESLQGFAKILATAGHFVATGHYARKYSVQAVRVTTNAQLKKGSIDISACIQIIEEHPLIVAGVSAAFGAVVQRILSRKDREEMEHLAAALKQALEQNKELAANSQQMSERLLATVEKMSDGLTAACRQAMAPIGKSCTTISLAGDGKTFVTADQKLKDLIEADYQPEIVKSTTYEGLISELDKETGSCKISIEEGDRVSGIISDPALSVSGNVYIKAFAEDIPLRVTAKAQTDKDGGIVKLFISDAELLPVHEQ